MNKQLIQEIINVDNKVINTVPLKYSVETKDMTYYGYDGLYYDYNHVELVYDYDNEINLSYKDVIDIKVDND